MLYILLGFLIGLVCGGFLRLSPTINIYPGQEKPKKILKKKQEETEIYTPLTGFQQELKEFVTPKENKL